LRENKTVTKRLVQWNNAVSDISTHSVDLGAAKKVVLWLLLLIDIKN
jgi:hypothetical protein